MVLLLLKPQVAPLVVLERARAAAPRALVAAAAAAFALVVASVVVRPEWPAEWVNELIGHRAAIAGTSATLYGLATWLTGQATVGLAVVALAVVSFALLLRGAFVGDALDRVAVAVTMGLLAVPYLSSGDPIVLAAAWCAILRRAGPRPLGIVLAVIVAADVVPWLLYVMREPAAPPGDIRNALELPVTAAVLAFALRRRPSEDRATPAPS